MICFVITISFQCYSSHFFPRGPELFSISLKTLQGYKDLAVTDCNLKVTILTIIIIIIIIIIVIIIIIINYCFCYYFKYYFKENYQL